MGLIDTSLANIQGRARKIHEKQMLSKMGNPLYGKVESCQGLIILRKSKCRCSCKDQPDFVQTYTEQNRKQPWNLLPLQCQRSDANPDLHRFWPSEVEAVIMRYYITLSRPGNNTQPGDPVTTWYPKPLEASSEAGCHLCQYWIHLWWVFSDSSTLLIPWARHWPPWGRG